jgi:hypothetical protein
VLGPSCLVVCSCLCVAQSAAILQSQAHCWPVVEDWALRRAAAVLESLQHLIPSAAAAQHGYQAGTPAGRRHTQPSGCDIKACAGVQAIAVAAWPPGHPIHRVLPARPLPAAEAVRSTGTGRFLWAAISNQHKLRSSSCT